MMLKWIAIFGIGFVLASVQAKADCAGCEAVHASADKLRALAKRKAKPKEISAQLGACAKAVLAMPKSNGNKLSLPQVHEVVELLRVTAKLDNVQFVVEELIELIDASRNDFKDEIKRLPAAEGQDINQDINIVERQIHEGSGD